jgi:hypothetical protein
MWLRSSVLVLVVALPSVAAAQPSNPDTIIDSDSVTGSADGSEQTAVLASPESAQRPEAPPPPLPQPPATPGPSPAAKATLARWLELQSATLNLRYRYVNTSAGVVTTNQVQHREALRGRFRFDAPGRYALNFGIFTGVRFSSGWDNTSWGINDAQKNLAFKTLYATAQPWKGVEAQLGGLQIVKGESTEITSYDEDGYITGERFTVRRPDMLLFDEISVTSAHFVGGTGPAYVPVSKRFPRFGNQNYQQYLVDKKIGTRAAVSTEYTRELGRITWRQALNLKVREARVVDSIIVEVYERTKGDPGHGFAITADKVLTKTVSVNGGYASIDRQHGPLNSDRFNIGDRAFVMVTYTFSPQLLASVFITTAVGTNGALPQRTLSNSVVTYNVMPLLKRSGLF